MNHNSHESFQAESHRYIGGAESPHSTENQKRLLFGLQQNHAAHLHEIGTVARLKQALSPLTRLKLPLAVYWEGQAQTSGETADKYVISVEAEQINRHGYGEYAYSSRVVAEENAGSLVPQAPFTAEDAEAVKDMVHILKTARLNGWLPDLSADCTAIPVDRIKA